MPESSLMPTPGAVPALALAAWLARFVAIPAMLPGFPAVPEQNIIVGNPNWFAFSTSGSFLHSALAKATLFQVDSNFHIHNLAINCGGALRHLSVFLRLRDSL